MPANADAPAAAGSNALLKEGASPATDARDVLADFFARFPSLRDPGKAARTLPAERAMPEHEAAAAAPEKAPMRRGRRGIRQAPRAGPQKRH